MLAVCTKLASGNIKNIKFKILVFGNIQINPLNKKSQLYCTVTEISFTLPFAITIPSPYNVHPKQIWNT